MDQVINTVTAILPGLLGQALLGAIGLTVTAAGIWVVSFLRKKVSKADLDLLTEIAEAAVKAAEQNPAAQDKKQSALNAAAAMLAQVGIEVSAEALDAAIEAAVMDIFNYDYDNADVKPSFVKKSPADDA